MNEMFRKECEEMGINYSKFPFDFPDGARMDCCSIFKAMMWILKKRQEKMETVKIASCRAMTGKEWCPAEYDSYCMLGKNIDTIHDGIPFNCPLIKSPILLQLKTEVLIKKQNG